MKPRSTGIALVALVFAAAAGIGLATAQPAREAAAVRFAAIDVYVDSAEPLAAWQFELSESTGAMAVVGVENGDSGAFPNAPRYDLDAVRQSRADRIIVADYSLADRTALPRGLTRVATVHVRLAGSGTPDFELRLIAAGNARGEPIPAAATLQLQDGRAP